MALFTDNSPSIPLQVFTGKNYDFWSLRLKTYFDSQNLWNVVKNGGSNLTNNALSEAERMTLEDQNRQKDVQALFIIQQAVSDTIFIKIKDAKTAKEAWDILEKEFRSDEVPSDSYGITPPQDQHRIDIESEYQPPQDQHIIDIVPADYQPCIYKVPDILREGKPEAFTPKLISIGPIHHGKSELRQMEQQKRTYLRFFEECLPSGSNNLHDYIDFLKNNEGSIRSCYSEKYPQFNKYQFVNMILLDSVFIMEFFLRQSRQYNYQDDDLISKWWLSKGITQDLLLLENQIPIFVLEALYNSCVPPDSRTFSRFLDLASYYFWYHFPFIDLDGRSFWYYFHKNSPRPLLCFIDLANKCFKWCRRKEEEIDPLDLEKNVNHFMDMIRDLLIADPLRKVDDRGPFPIPKTAAKLMESGVSFKPVSNRPLLDIKFETSCLGHFLCLGCFPYCSDCFKAQIEFPKLLVDHSTESILWNLIALEQCHYPRQRQICSYVSMLSYLIHSKEDVESLVEKDVIVHKLANDEELVTMISGLSKPIMVSSNYYYGKVMKALDNHYDNKWKRFMGAIRWVYFRDLLRSTTTLVGVLVISIALLNLLHNLHVI